MKNKDVYLEEFVRKSLIEENGGIDFMKEHGIADYFDNHEPLIVCIDKLLAWFEEEYHEPITLTDDEKTILKNVPKNTKWIARDQNERLYLYCKEPQKMMDWWCSEWTKYDFSPYNRLFEFIKWQDEKPYNIDELLKQNGVER